MLRLLLSGSFFLGSAGALFPGDVPVVSIKGIQGQVDMPLLGLGTWLYNSSVAEGAVTTAFGMGYRHVDTAAIYANQDGVGKALSKANLPRDEFFVTFRRT
jgi:diketogulonate reductase-like aldo/keto reductase